jgi:hypothetical protein
LDCGAGPMVGAALIAVGGVSPPPPRTLAPAHHDPTPCVLLAFRPCAVWVGLGVRWGDPVTRTVWLGVGGFLLLLCTPNFPRRCLTTQ